MQDLGFYFKLGWAHIISWEALDHLLFVLALSAVYLISDWKKVLILITAFTLGHSLTLILSVLDVVRLNDKLVEILIPCTIIVTAGLNLLQQEFGSKSLRRNYFLAFFFGLIHGLGFANYIRFIMSKDDSIATDLLGFNLGLEAGQIVVVTAILIISYLILDKLNAILNVVFKTAFTIKRIWWVWATSIFAIVIAAKMIWERV